MVLIIVAEPIVDVDLAQKILFQLEINLAFAGLVSRGPNYVGTFVRRSEFRASRVVDDMFANFVGEVEERNANGNESNADYEEGGQNSAGGQNGLPGRQALLFECRICEESWI